MDKKYFFWFMILFAGFLLNGCTHISKKDGPPDFYVDETKVPNAVPRLEPLSKNGNMDHYTVFGKRYYIMKSSTHYEERGIASWYGTKFHSRHTSNGERYNMLAMTAAHKTLPLPTYVQVTNLRNHKQVIVKVNDRGPFESNRLIDLSYVAAKKLGMIGHGTTWVDVKSVDPRDALDNPDLIAKNKTASPQSNDPLHYLNQKHYVKAVRTPHPVYQAYKKPLRRAPIRLAHNRTMHHHKQTTTRHFAKVEKPRHHVHTAKVKRRTRLVASAMNEKPKIESSFDIEQEL